MCHRVCALVVALMIDGRLNRYDIVKLFVYMTKFGKTGEHSEDVESEHKLALCK